jgi:hypothetical protein
MRATRHRLGGTGHNLAVSLPAVDPAKLVPVRKTQTQTLFNERFVSFRFVSFRFVVTVVSSSSF